MKGKEKTRVYVGFTNVGHNMFLKTVIPFYTIPWVDCKNQM